MALETLMQVSSTASIQYVFPPWVYILFYAVIGLAVAFVVALAFLIYGMGPVGRKLFWYKGNAVFLINPEGTYQIERARRDLPSVLKVENKRLQHPYLLLRPGSALPKPGTITFFIGYLKENTVINPKLHLYGEALRGRRSGLATRPQRNPKSALDAILSWKEEKLRQMAARLPTFETWEDYMAKRADEVKLAEDGKLDPSKVRPEISREEYLRRVETQTQRLSGPIQREYQILQEVRDGQVRRRKPDGELEEPLTTIQKQNYVDGLLMEIASSPDAEWPCEIMGETLDLRDISAWNIHRNLATQLQEAKRIGTARALVQNKSENARLMILVLGIMGIIIAGVIAAKLI